MKKITTFLAAICFGLTGFAQKSAYAPQPLVPSHRTCSTMEVDSIYRAANPSAGSLSDFETALQQVINNLQQQRSMMPGPYDIPTIVHVIHNGTAVGTGLNLSQAQVYSQYDVLNEDYNNTNADGSLVPSAFQPLRGSLQMNFKKALRDPAGNTLSEPGINRIDRNTKGWTAPPYTQTYINNTIKPNSYWDPTKYFNVWVTDISGGLLGWAQFPSTGNANTDGVVVLYSAFGRIGNVAAPYNKGRTLTHEAGHFFGLRHIWGDEAQCAADDNITDTPQQKDQNYGCPTYPQTTQAGGRCNTSDPSSMFMNYMDYTDDACMYMFTQGQATRMEAVVNSAPRRVELTTSTVATPLNSLDATISSIIKPTGSFCNTTFIPSVILTNLGSSTLTTVTITYNIDGGTPVIFNWSGSVIAGGAVTVNLPSVTSTVGAHMFNVATSAPNGGTDGNTSNDSRSQAFTILAAPSAASLPLTEGFTATTFVPAGWTLVNPDANNTWSRVTNAGGFGNSTNSAKMDNYSGQINIAGQTDDMLTPVYNLSTANSTLKMTFNVAHAMYSASYIDSLLVEVTTDCGATWNRVYAKGGTSLSTAPNTTADFTPTATQWRRDSIMLASYAGTPYAQFRFRSKSGYGNNVFLDDINLNFTPSTSAPVAAFTANATTVCAGTAITYTDQSTNSPTSWSWSFPGGTPSTSTSQNPTVVYSTAGTYNAVLTATNGGGSNTLTKTNYITVNALPSVAVTAGNNTICMGSSTTLVSTGATTYTWSPAGTLSGTSGSTVTATPTSTTTYTVTGTTGSCTKTASVTVTVNPRPTLTVSPASSTICSGGSSALTVSGATTATWSPSSGLSSTSGLTVTASPGATTTYTVTGTNANGCTNTATAVVTVSGTLTVSVSPSTVSLCAGTSTQLTASGATTYSWSPTTGLSATTGATVTAGPSTTITYTVTGTSGSCTATATRAVTILPNPSITTSGSGAICAGASRTISASGAGTGATYTWNPGALSGATVSVTPASTTTYTVTASNTNGCTRTSTATVTVNALPATTAAASPQTICSGSSSTLNVTGAATYTWSPGASLSATSGTTVVATPVSTTTYTVTGTSSQGCQKTATVAVTVTPIPVISASANSSTICQGESSQLTVSGSASTYSWSPGGSLSGTTGATVVATPSSTTTYTVTGTMNGCTGTTTVSVTVVPNPVIVSTSSATSICAGGSSTLVASGAGTGGSYSWSPSATLSSSTGASVTATPVSTTTYTVTGTNAAGCTGTSVRTISVSQNPVVIASAGSSSICSGSSTMLTASGTASYNWSPSATLSSSSGSSVTATPAATTTYTVTGTSGAGCYGTAVVTVNVDPTPVAGAMATPDSTSIGSPVSFMNMSTNGTSYMWTFGDGNTSISSDPIHTYGSAGIYTVMLTATNGNCSSSTTILVEITGPNGIQKADAVPVTLYPNPTSGHLTILFGTSKPETFVITDALGNLILEKKGTELSSTMDLDLSFLAKGVYFARVMDGNNGSVIRFVVQ